MQSVAVAQMGDTAIGSGAVVPVADRDLVEKLLVHAADHLALVGANRYRTRWHLSRHVSLSVDVRIHGAAVLGGVLGYTVTPPLLPSYLLRGIGEEIAGVSTWEGGGTDHGTCWLSQYQGSGT